MNKVTINPNNPGYKYPAMALGAGIVVIGTGGTIASLAPALTPNAEKIVAETGTVWDDIVPTASNIPGTNVPATFQINVAGRTLWANANATEHMGEYLTRVGKLPSSPGVSAQQMLTSFRAATNQAMQSVGNQPAGRYFGNYGGWELGINTETGVIYHALMR